MERGNTARKKTTRLGGLASMQSNRVGEKFSRTKDVAVVGYEKTKVVALEPFLFRFNKLGVRVLNCGLSLDQKGIDFD